MCISIVLFQLHLALKTFREIETEREKERDRESVGVILLAAISGQVLALRVLSCHCFRPGSAMSVQSCGASQPARLPAAAEILPRSSAACASGEPLPMDTSTADHMSSCLTTTRLGKLRSASQPAARPDEGARPAAKQVLFHVARFTVASFNFGMPQTMLTGQKWPEHAKRLSRVYERLAVGAQADFIFGSEMGGIGEGFSCAEVDIANIVDVALPGAKGVCAGAYTSVYNIRDHTA